MNTSASKIIVHLALMVGITALIVLCIVYPFLPGEYDGLAMALSTMAQAFGVFGLLLVPVGILWLIYELWKGARRKQNLPAKARGYSFALVSVVIASLVALVVSGVAFATVGFSLGFLTLALWIYIVSRLIPRVRSLKNAGSENFNPVSLYLIFIPIAVLLFQITLAAPLTEFSRDHAITMSAEFVMVFFDSDNRGIVIFPDR